MPTKKIEVTIELSDYFCKFGFGDGDDGAAVDMGRECRSQAVDIINDELKKAGSRAHAEEYDPMSMHNNCQIIVTLTDDRGCIDIDDSSLKTGESGSLTDDAKKKIDGALAEARDRFEKEA